jgi:hypothetical protein
MQIITVTNLVGTPPFDIYICDVSINYCFLVASSVTTVPIDIELPSFLSGVDAVVARVYDSERCEEIYLIPCLLPTPSITVTPSFTPTPSVTSTKRLYPCFCIEFDNSGSGENIGYSYYDCNNVLITDKALDGDVFTVCGSNPSSDNIKLSFTILGDCPSGSCGRGPAGITPTPTPTDKSPNVALLVNGRYSSGSVSGDYTISSNVLLEKGLTVFFKNILPKEDGNVIEIDTDITIFPGNTTGQTNFSVSGDFDTLTRESQIKDVTYGGTDAGLRLSFSATSFFSTPTNTVTSSITPTITLTNTPTNTFTPTQTPTQTTTPSITPSITPTISITPSITKTPTVTRTQTPTRTVTPSVTSVPRTAYLFIEPISGASAIGNWMYTVNGLNFFGFSNATQPTQNQTDFNIQLNTYVDYSGWTSGQFPTLITQDVPQTSGGVDSFGNSITAYNFKTTFVPSTTTGSRGWYTWVIPVGATNNLTQTQIDYSLSNPNVMTTLTMESTIYSYTFTYTGNTIPKTTYKVYTTYPNGDFAFDANTAIYFKGNTVA